MVPQQRQEDLFTSVMPSRKLRPQCCSKCGSEVSRCFRAPSQHGGSTNKSKESEEINVLLKYHAEFETKLALNKTKVIVAGKLM